jgi:rhodanese-related sulfurtransferase
MSVKTISPQELAKLQASGQEVVLIDVRTPLEFNTVHVGFAKNVPLDQLDATELSKTSDNKKSVYVICHAGNRSTKACERMAALGYLNAVSVEGGTAAWSAAGLPVVRNLKIISLDRQVRIAAGLLVIVGGVLSLTVHLAYVWLSIFVGGGLVFAGITNTCGMGLLLAKMPWNKASGTQACGSDAPTCSSKP